MSIKKVFYKIYRFPFLISILYQYSDTFLQIYIANSIDVFFNKALDGNTGYIAKNSIGFIGIIFGVMLIQYLIALHVDCERQRKKQKFKRYLYEEFLNNSLIQVEKLTTGEILTRFDEDVDKVISAFDGSWGIIAASVISAVTYVAYMGRVNLTAAIIIFVLGCLPFIPSIILKKAFAANYDGYYKIEDMIAGHIKETIDGFEHIKLNNMYSRMEKAYYKLQKGMGKWAMSVEKTFITGKSMKEGLLSIAKFGMYGLMGYFLYKNIINPGDVVLMVLLSTKLFRTLQAIFDEYQNLAEAKVAVERVNEMLPKELKEEENKGHSLEDIKTIEINNLVFKYEEKPVIDGASLSVKKGEKLLIVGSNGSGKSTITKILLGLYRDYEGEVKINGIPIDKLNLKSYRNLIAWIPQEQYFYPGDAAFNMKLLSNKVSLGFSECASAFEIDRDIAEGRPCDNLSGGQRQRISLTRGLCRDGDLYILDEPSNYLDSKGIDMLKSFIKESDRTIITISHDENLIEAFDRVVRLQAGRFLEVKRNEK